jgi:hypothetical protein
MTPGNENRRAIFDLGSGRGSRDEEEEVDPKNVKVEFSFLNRRGSNADIGFVCRRSCPSRQKRMSFGFVKREEDGMLLLLADWRGHWRFYGRRKREDWVLRNSCLCGVFSIVILSHQIADGFPS